MNCTDVVVVEWRGCLRFPNETPLFFSTATELDEQKLKGYKAVEFEILRAITL
jgi:predicted alpha/beta-fold hydrolase